MYSDTYRLHDIIKYSLICYFNFRRVNIYANDDRCAKTSNSSPSNFFLTQMMAETFPTIFVSCYKFTCGFPPNILKPLSRRCFLISRIILETSINIRANIIGPCNSNLVVLDKILLDKLIDSESVSLILRYDFPKISVYFSRISNKSFHNLFSRQMLIETFLSVFLKKKKDSLLFSALSNSR